MSKPNKDKLAVAIDIGTTKICVLVGKQKADKSIEVLGIGTSPSHGLNKGVVVDIAKTVKSIKHAIKEAEFTADVTIESATVGISGSHIESFNSHGVIPIKKGFVTPSDIINVLTSAKAIAIPEGQQILHTLPKYYMIDAGDKISDPLNMSGIRLEAYVHVITGSIASVQNIIRCCEMAEIRVDDIILEQLASAEAVLSADEQELGVGVLDIGGGTSDFAIYQKGSIRHTKVLPIAGNQFTNDVAIGIQASVTDAQRIKEEYGIAHAKSLASEGSIAVEVVQGGTEKEIQQASLLDILNPRTEELLLFLKEEIEKHDLHPLMTTGLVLTGGGSLLGGIDLVAQEILGVSARIGNPRTGNVLPGSLDNPKYATSYGLLLHAFNTAASGRINSSEPLAARLFSTMKSWVSDFF